MFQSILYGGFSPFKNSCQNFKQKSPKHSLGDKCFHQNKGVNGICRVLTDCPTAIDDIRHGIYPQHCGFEGTVVIACCPQASESPITTTTTTTTTTESSQIPNPTGNLPVGEKCKQ
ncbi:hypothetical protein Trydic_g3739, partial [Trypoxylus dichotomus]